MYDKSIPFGATIKWIKKETRDTFTCAVKINSRDIQRKYSFFPGQFNMLYVPGIGEVPISISSSPLEHDIMHTVRIAGDVTTALSRLRNGEVIGMRGPFGKDGLLEEAEGLGSSDRGRRPWYCTAKICCAVYPGYPHQEEERRPAPSHVTVRCKNAKGHYLQG